MQFSLVRLFARSEKEESFRTKSRQKRDTTANRKTSARGEGENTELETQTKHFWLEFSPKVVSERSFRRKPGSKSVMGGTGAHFWSYLKPNSLRKWTPKASRTVSERRSESEAEKMSLAGKCDFRGGAPSNRFCSPRPPGDGQLSKKSNNNNSTRDLTRRWAAGPANFSK